MFKELVTRHHTHVVITGDSLSFNRYDFDEYRGMNAYDYGAGLGSWSFLIRDKLYTKDAQFIYGADMTFSCKTVSGLATATDLPHTALFDGRIKTLFPSETVTFRLPIQTDELVLYLQHRADTDTVFDVAVDGVTVQADVHTIGDTAWFAGYAPLVLRLPCDGALSTHAVTFARIRGEVPCITVAGAGAVYRQVTLSGRGCTCADFFLENFEERIAKYTPDLLLFSVSANDRLHVSAEKMCENVDALFGMIQQRFPYCRVLVLAPPHSHDPDNPQKDVSPYTALETAEKYDSALEAVCGRWGHTVFRISSLFDDADVSAWRYDNIHLNKQGNAVLADAVSRLLGL
ncbi:MAG: SGNH/GDSL hydrolase family protein [Clostridia bacterium]|nr:SGNH/GDSL hydrolase family protein [Clostridia bacterium]